MSTQFLKPNKVIQVRDLTHIFLELIAAQPDNFVAKTDNVPANPGVGGQRKDPHMVI